MIDKSKMLKSILSTSIANDRDVAIRALNNGFLKPGAPCALNNREMFIAGVADHPIPKACIASLDDLVLWPNYCDATTVNKERILAELKKRQKRGALLLPYRIRLEKTDNEQRKFVLQVCLDHKLPRRKLLGVDDSFWNKVIEERKRKRGKVYKPRKPRKQIYERIRTLVRLRRQLNRDNIIKTIASITEQEWNVTKSVWLADLSIIHTAVWVPFLTEYELRFIWNSCCNLQTLRWFPTEIPKDILFSLPADSVIRICEFHFADELKIKPPLDDADEVYLASIVTTSQIVNDGLKRLKEIRLINLLMEEAKLKTRVKVIKEDKKIISVLLGDNLWIYNVGVRVLSKPAEDVLNWWNSIDDLEIKIAWAKELSKFYETST